MKKESLSFRIFWFLFTFAPMFLLIGAVLIPFNLDSYLHHTISIGISYLYTKNVIDKEDLDNQIFELKELIKKEKL